MPCSSAHIATLENGYNEGFGPSLEVEAWLLTSKNVRSFGIGDNLADEKTVERWLEELCGVPNESAARRRAKEEKKRRAGELRKRGKTQVEIGDC